MVGQGHQRALRPAEEGRMALLAQQLPGKRPRSGQARRESQEVVLHEHLLAEVAPEEQHPNRLGQYR